MSSVTRLSIFLRTAMATQMCAFIRLRPQEILCLLEANCIRVNRFRADCGSCSKEMSVNKALHTTSAPTDAVRSTMTCFLRGWKTEGNQRHPV